MEARYLHSSSHPYISVTSYTIVAVEVDLVGMAIAMGLPPVLR
jgi:hypothetical protein